MLAKAFVQTPVASFRRLRFPPLKESRRVSYCQRRDLVVASEWGGIFT